MTKNKKILKIIDILSLKYPNPQTPLYHRNMYELLTAIMFSAQMTDKRLNEILPVFFRKFKSFEDIHNAKLESIENFIRSVNYYKTKAKHIKGTAEKIIINFNGKIPSDMESLLSLPGIGRKSANIILNEGFKVKNIGVVVDTHVKRLTNRIFGESFASPIQTEKFLLELVPPQYYKNIALWLISHGRNTCTAQSPQCEQCALAKLCEHWSANTN